MALEFRNGRRPSDIGQLSALDCKQLEIVGDQFDGETRSAESRLRDEPVDEDAEFDWDDGNLAAHGLAVYEAWEGDRHVYDVWVHHGSDNGCVFNAGTTEVIAGRFQDTWMDPSGSTQHPLDEELHDAEAKA